MVTIAADNATLCSGTLAGGKLSCSVSTSTLAAATYTVVTHYSGDATYNSASQSLSATLNPAPTSATLTAAPNPVTPPGEVTLAATVKRTASGATGTPGGSVSFYYSTLLLGTAKLNGSGVATYSASSNDVPAGSYAITAHYQGDSGDAACVSSAVSVRVQ